MQARLLGGATGLAMGIAWGIAAESDEGTPALADWRGADALMLGLASGAWLAPKLFDKESPALGRGRFSDCEGKQDGLGSVDRRVRQVLAGRTTTTERERAARWSDATLGASILYSLGLSVAGAPPHRERDVLVTLGTLGVSLAVTDAVKHFFDRPRPYTHFCEPAHPGDLCERDAQLSFYSGHASTSFAAVVAAGRLARMHGYRNQGGIWATGLALATATGVLRIKADKHYLTDVLAGGLAGALAGWFLPGLHEPKPESDPSLPGTPAAQAGPPSIVSVAIPGRAPGTGVLVQAGLGDGVSLSLAWRF